METSRFFMPLLRSLTGWGANFAINMSRLTALPRFSGSFAHSEFDPRIVIANFELFDQANRQHR